MKITKPDEIVTGYKATDKNMKCNNYQFELGKWFVHDGPIELCKSGFHFCPHPSGPWAYDTYEGTRIFRVEAKDVHQEYQPGADLKYVAKMIRFVEEIEITGNRNTGDGNTGNRNTGDGNTGNRNTGNRNTGNRNTGNRNTGDGNTGNWNTGNWNTGYWNTGNRNTGNRNTGYWNATNNSSGMFCAKEPFIISFDKQTQLTRQQFLDKYPIASELGEMLCKDELFDYAKYKDIPGWTLEKCKALHQAHINGRKVVVK